MATNPFWRSAKPDAKARQIELHDIGRPRRRQVDHQPHEAEGPLIDLQRPYALTVSARPRGICSVIRGWRADAAPAFQDSPAKT